jgi:uncharacterized protein YpmS
MTQFSFWNWITLSLLALNIALEFAALVLAIRRGLWRSW